MHMARQGQLSIQVLIFSAVATILVGAFSAWAFSLLRISVRSLNKVQAFSIAEAGIEYYRWHLAHAPNDFEDGTGAPGPYVHTYYDKESNVIGMYTLDITPPPAGSSMVKIRSTGKVFADDSISKIIEVQFDIPSLASFAVVGNNGITIPASTTVYGRLHSNGGIRFDGIAHNLITSAASSYNDPSHGGSDLEFGVHTHVLPVDPIPPAQVPTRSDVFLAGRQFPVPAVDFQGITGDLATLKSIAQGGGHYVASSTTKLGYHIVLKINDTFDLYRVDDLVKKPPGCNDIVGQDQWGTWSIDDETSLGNYPFPANGIIFVEDHVWVDGIIENARITIATGAFPENPTTYKSIVVNNDLRYTYYDGRDAIGLIAQNNITVGLISEDDLRIDGAMVAKNGRFGRYYYRPKQTQGNGGCQPYHVRTLITTYGMIASNNDLQFSYSDITGYLTRVFIYDAFLLFTPPPNFPLVGNQYVQISWKEIQ